MDSYTINYNALLEDTINFSMEEMIAFLSEELPLFWCDSYEKMTSHPTSIVQIQHNSFTFLYDAFNPLDFKNTPDIDHDSEDRLVAVFGLSEPIKKVRDDSRLRGWVGPTEKFIGRKWDKGHFIANSIGGTIEGIEINAFIQRRDLNRGWSTEGKVFREMEKYCASNSGIFTFRRPIYFDQSGRPALLECGILKKNCDLWVECFNNQ